MSVRLPASPLGLAIALALSSAAVPALAQDATNLDTVIVTGTRAADRTVLESTSPVDVLTAEDIRKAGVVNGELGSALQALLPSFNFPRQSNSGGADHVRAHSCAACRRTRCWCWSMASAATTPRWSTPTARSARAPPGRFQFDPGQRDQAHRSTA
jgi:hypothetical protein